MIDVFDLLSKHNISLVGEYTLPSGPMGDDYFVAVVFDNQTIVELQPEQLPKALSIIENKLNFAIDFSLCASTEAASRIIYPSELRGKPMFDFEMQPQKGFYQFVKKLYNFGIVEITSNLTEEVINFLKSKK